MSLQEILLMRHELVLIVGVLMMLIGQIFMGDNAKGFINMAIGFSVISLVVGFLPAGYGDLFGGMYHTDSIQILMKNILNFGVLIVVLQSAEWLKTEENKHKVAEFYIMLFSTLIGMFYMISAGDFILMYLGLELATIPAAIMVAYDRYSDKSAEAGVKMIFTSALSSGVILYGISMIYGTTGSIYFTDIAANIDATNTLTVLGLILFISGMGFKISLVPFHLWTADVYEGAPINVTSYLSVISKGAAAFVFTFILYRVFGSMSGIWSNLLYIVAIMTMTIGNLFALRQKNMKRFLAFSSIAQAGFILLGVLGHGEQGMASVVYFMLVYVVTNLAAFGVVSAIYDQTGFEKMDDYAGLYRTNPKLSFAMMIAMFSLAGIPPVAGFFSKFFLFTSAAQSGYYILVLIAVLNTTISLYYYLKVVKAMFIDPTDNPIPFFKSPFATRAALVISIIAVFVIGFASSIYEYIVSISLGLQ